ncbi:MAG: DUF2141 domain-containing protein [Saprospiraceae bacterium]|nr:DUF2141 domain-containing protein [Saprospiraceae bacterium]
MLLSFLLSLMIVGQVSYPPSQITLSVSNITSVEGMIWIGIYDAQENFLIKEKAIVKGYRINHPGKMDIVLANLPNGTYAIAVFHDINNNGHLDQNLLGVPTEPFAFTKKPPSKFRLPTFHEVSHILYPEMGAINVTLKKWWKH